MLQFLIAIYTDYATGLDDQLKVPQHVRKHITLYGTRKFITAFAIARHLSLSRGIQTQSTYFYLIKTHFNIILQSMPWPSGLSMSMYFSPVRVTNPASLILLDLIIRIICGKEYCKKTHVVLDTRRNTYCACLQ
jgi:hypothetical protein